MYYQMGKSHDKVRLALVKILNKVDSTATIPFTMETRANLCVPCNVPCIVSSVYAMVACEFDPVICICVSITKGIVTSTLHALTLIINRVKIHEFLPYSQ